MISKKSVFLLTLASFTLASCSDDASGTSQKPESCDNVECNHGICNPETLQCVECMNNDDCTHGICNPETLQCVECMNNDDCTDGVCNPETRQCVGCMNNDDCTDGVCNPETLQCVGCMNNDDCTTPENSVCDTDTHQCRGCNDNSECASGRCDVETHVCLGCANDSECLDPAYPVCALDGVNAHACVACTPETQSTHCTEASKPVCAIDDQPSAANRCVECNPGENPLDPSPDCEGRTSDNDTPRPYCAATPSKDAHTCVECIPNADENDTGIDDTCLNIEKDGILTQVCADSRAAEAIQNTCVECDDDAVKTQCAASPATPICNLDTSSENAYRCVACNADEPEIGNAQCAKKDSAKPFCLPTNTTAGIAGSCVECLTSEDCGDGSVCNNQFHCVECDSRTDDTQCTDPQKAICCDEAAAASGQCTDNSDTGVHKCEKCDISTNCIGGVCNETTGKCEPCQNDSDCASVERGICFEGVCTACATSGDTKNCDLVCNEHNGKCEPCVDIADDAGAINCIKVCDDVRETCEPCDNNTYYCRNGVCDLDPESPSYGFCQVCSDTNCIDGTCGEDGLCHKTCTEGTLCSAPGFDYSREQCCIGTEICTTSGTCITPGNECTKDTECTTWDKCDIPDGQETGHCVPVASDPNACFTIPTFDTILPKIKWHYETECITPPVVIDLTGDGIPEVVFVDSLAGKSSASLYALSGTDGTLIAKSAKAVFNRLNDIAAADVDNDGQIEVIVPSGSTSTTTTGLYFMNLVKNEDETYAWQEKQFLKTPYDYYYASNGYYTNANPTVADIDEDGIPEIVTKWGIIKGNKLSEFACTYTLGYFSNWYGFSTAVADLDQDGSAEIISEYIFDPQCNKIDDGKAAGWGYQAVADLLPDDGTAGEAIPEIVRVKGTTSSGSVSVWKAYKGADGKWTQKKVWEKAHPGNGGGNPIIADFNGDGQADIGVAGKTSYAVFDGKTGNILWKQTTNDASSFRTGSSVFDFEADGKAEVVYRDQTYLRIYNGSDGAELWKTPMSSGTVIEYPLIVDVDGDDKTEIVAVSNKENNSSIHTRFGVTVFEDTYGKWVPSRKIWNQHSYHVTNINDDGTVPKHEEANWLNKRLNNYRANVPPEGFYNQPNFVPGLLVEDKTNCKASPKSLGLKATVANLGDKKITTDIQISFYLTSEDETKNYYIGTKSIDGLDIDAKKSTTLDWDQKTVYEIIDNTISPTETTLSNLSGYKAYFVVDDVANTSHPTYEECNEDDNALISSQYIVLTGC